MAILVTGGCGYIGSHLVWALTDRGENVIVLDNLSTGFDWAIPPEVELVRGDIGDRDLLDRLLGRSGVDVIVHFAGSVIVPASVSDPLEYYFNNTVKSRELIAAAVRHDVKNFVFSSTAAIYGNPDVIPVPEDVVPKPMSPYGSSKLMTEIMLTDTAVAHDFRYVVLRYFNVCGADPRGRTGQSTKGATHLVKVACETALGRRLAIEVFGTDYPTRDGTGVRDYIHVTDLAEAHVLAVRHLRERQTSLVANCGYGRGFSVLDVLKAVERVTGRPLPVVIGPRRAGDTAEVVAEVRRIHAHFDWTPKWDHLDTIISHALAWEEQLVKRNRI